ncbi:MAG: PHP domain-containing protein, partial [Planctomycetota bacterium]
MPENDFQKMRPHPAKSPTGTSGSDRGGFSPAPVGYAELSVTSNFTFLTGASHPEELVERAAALGHRAVAITDTNSLAGVVRAHVAAKGAGIPLVVGCRLAFECGRCVCVYPIDRPAYARLCRLLTLGKRRASKGECRLALHDLIEHAEGLLAVIEPPTVVDDAFIETVRGLRSVFDRD